MYGLLRPLLFKMSPTSAHAVAMAALSPVEHLSPLRAVVRAAFRVSDPRLEVRKMGLVFPTPIGVAGGFDKNAERAGALAALGFGHVELGTITAEAQGPNPPPNLFRLPADRALVNRLGFPNEGAEHVASRIRAKKKGIGVPVGISIGKSRSVPLDKAVDDYLASYRAIVDLADFVVVNISSPNTKDLRALQAADTAKQLFSALKAEKSPVPLLVKIAPDLPDESIDAICDVAMEHELSGIVATNTTISREGLLTSKDEIEKIGAGGLSGLPLLPRALSVVKRVRARVGPKPCVIGVGGVDSTETTLAMLKVGADLVQIYTGFIYKGPSLPRTIAKGLLAHLEHEGQKSISEVAVA